LTKPAHALVRTSDGQGTIFIDGKQVGTSSFEGVLDAGEHDVRVERAGYEPFEKKVPLDREQVRVETVTLRPRAEATRESGGQATRVRDGLYTGFQLGFAMMPGGQDSTLDTGCDSLGATRCDSSSPIGGGIAAYLGYALDPLGFEMLVGGQADVAEPKATFDGVHGSSINPLIAKPARDEQFGIYRAGVLGAVRMRGNGLADPLARKAFGIYSWKPIDDPFPLAESWDTSQAQNMRDIAVYENPETCDKDMALAVLPDGSESLTTFNATAVGYGPYLDGRLCQSGGQCHYRETSATSGGVWLRVSEFAASPGDSGSPLFLDHVMTNGSSRQPKVVGVASSSNGGCVPGATAEKPGEGVVDDLARLSGYRCCGRRGRVRGHEQVDQAEGYLPASARAWPHRLERPRRLHRIRRWHLDESRRRSRRRQARHRLAGRRS
jgi:hypothetical protein